MNMTQFREYAMTYAASIQDELPDCSVAVHNDVVSVAWRGFSLSFDTKFVSLRPPKLCPVARFGQSAGIVGSAKEALELLRGVTIMAKCGCQFDDASAGITVECD